MTKQTVLSIGSSLVDIFVTSDQFQLQSTDGGLLLCHTYGDKLELDSLSVSTGGGGSNTAVGLARLGFAATLVSELGKDEFAQLVLNDLNKSNVDISKMINERREQTGGSVILVGPSGDRTVMVHRGAASLLDPPDLPEALLKSADWVHLSSISGRHSTLKEIFHHRGEMKRLSWNPGMAELNLLAAGQFDLLSLPVEILFVNEKEWAVLRALHSILLTQIPVVVVTNGPKGGRVFVKGAEQRFDSLVARAVDATGAGDAFASGFVAGYLWQKPIDECVQLGLRNSTAVIQHFGAKTGLLTKDQILSSQ
jgi:ribokinase